MKTVLISFAICCFASTAALAECTPVVEGKVYQCDPPPQNSGPVRCKMLNGVLLCTGEIGQEAQYRANVVKPINCGYRRGQYVCW